MVNRALKEVLMAVILEGVSRTFAEYLLIPRLTRRDQRPDQVDLATPMSAVAPNQLARFSINVPVVSAAMQSVSGSRLAISLARQGGLAFIYCSQEVGEQADMVRQVKAHKAGFVVSDSNTTPGTTLREVIALMKQTGHSTIAVTEDGSAHGRLLGLITDQDFWEFEDDLENRVEQHMTPINEVIHGTDGISLREANQLLHRHKKNCLPILDDQGRLTSLVFKKDYEDHMRHPHELLDDSKRLLCRRGPSTHMTTRSVYLG